jgi:acetyl esterase/lipase
MRDLRGVEVEILPLADADREAEARWRAGNKRHWAESSDPARVTFERFLKLTPFASGVSCEDSAIAGWPGVWCRPEGVSCDLPVLYLHGGAYTMGSARGYARMASWLARYAQRKVFVLDYPLAPEHPFPAALDVASAVMDAMGQISIASDSAGSGLALAALHAKPRAQVNAVVAFSPWTDLTFSGSTVRDFDPVLPLEQLVGDVEAYRGSFDAREPGISPLFGVVAGMPPLLIQVAREELLLDDSLRYAERAAAAGNRLRLEVWEGMHHDFQMCTAELESAHAALRRAAEFLR